MLDITKAAELGDFAVACELITQMAAWDVVQTQALGIATDELVRTYYSDTPHQLMQKFDGPKAGMLLATFQGAVAGCIAFSDAGGGSSEIHKLFVSPGARGRGVARALMTVALEEMRRLGFARTRLETVSFMTDAIALYRSTGFQPCAPFHGVPQDLVGITLFFERPL